MWFAANIYIYLRLNINASSIIYDQDLFGRKVNTLFTFATLIIKYNHYVRHC